MSIQLNIGVFMYKFSKNMLLELLFFLDATKQL